MSLNILRLTYFLILKRRALVLFSLMERSLTWYSNKVSQLRFASIFTSTYLILSVGYSFLPRNFTFKWTYDFFCLDLKNTISVFLKLSKILFAFYQLTRCFKSALTSLFSFLIELLRQKRLVSSENWWTLQIWITWLRSFIYNKNRRCPRTDPWGTAQFIAARSDSYPFIDTYWLRLDR